MGVKLDYFGEIDFFLSSSFVHDTNTDLEFLVKITFPQHVLNSKTSNIGAFYQRIIPSDTVCPSPSLTLHQSGLERLIVCL